jgi:hypothetical protein
MYFFYEIISILYQWLWSLGVNPVYLFIYLFILVFSFNIELFYNPINLRLSFFFVVVFSLFILCTVDIELMKEISLCTSLSPRKPSYLSKDRGPLLGQSIFSINGLIWSHQRKIIAPEFYTDKVKVSIYFFFLPFLSCCTKH